MFKERDKIVRDASKIKSKYQYLLNDKKNLQNRIHYLEEKLKDVNEKATLVERKPESSLTNNISQAISNLVSLHYSRYSEKRVGREIADVVWPHNFMNGVV